jgi:phosphoglycolate phosphatase
MSKFRPGGKTDTQIIYEVLAQNGMDEQAIGPLVPKIRAKYLALLKGVVEGNPSYVALKPGVRELLADLHAHPEVLLGLLTGNFEEGARIKLGTQGLNGYFAFGAFGENARNRSDLPQRALEAAEQHSGHKFSRKEIVIIGDTPNDIHCGRHLQVRTIAVATGPFKENELLAEKPDFVFRDLSDTARVVSAILENLPNQGKF